MKLGMVVPYDILKASSRKVDKVINNEYDTYI